MSDIPILTQSERNYQNSHAPLFFLLLLVLIIALGFSYQPYLFSQKNTASISPIPTNTIPSVRPFISPTMTESPAQTQIKIYLVAIDAKGTSGMKIGCDDSLVAVNQTIDKTSTPLTAAMEKLLAIKTQYYGQSGLYNALYQSDLKLDKTSITNGTATIYVTGTMKLGGVCDSPRFAAQLKQTALQFPTVKNVEVFINNKPLDQVVSGK